MPEDRAARRADLVERWQRRARAFRARAAELDAARRFTEEARELRRAEEIETCAAELLGVAGEAARSDTAPLDDPTREQMQRAERSREMKPSIGRIVLFRSELSNGATEHPAIINRVWSDECVNLTVLPDCGAPVAKTSVVQNESLADGNQTYAWRWPPRETVQDVIRDMRLFLNYPSPTVPHATLHDFVERLRAASPADAGREKE